MRKDLYHTLHGDSVTTQIASTENIARELQQLNFTMDLLLEAIQLIAVKIKDCSTEDV